MALDGGELIALVASGGVWVEHGKPPTLLPVVAWGHWRVHLRRETHMRQAALFVAIVVAYVVAVAGLIIAVNAHGHAVGETGCTRVVHNYLRAASQAVGVTLHHEHLIACHLEGGVATARVRFVAEIPGSPDVPEVLALDWVHLCNEGVPTAVPMNVRLPGYWTRCPMCKCERP